MTMKVSKTMQNNPPSPTAREVTITYLVTTSEGRRFFVPVTRRSRDVNRAISCGFHHAVTRVHEDPGMLNSPIGQPFEPRGEHVSQVEFWEVTKS